ncbi:hypothetical protein F384_03560 [Citrobacter amalonaticus Y19]|uniref:Uncharacterized protein n=1 Tax=Citrobacter amalonaticus Y19 TaxID=1261127 RepID=A0A0F6RE76_CITAM|nr:hypothetical protein F384_03560 [Citrobacter amalonaticus Y19]
MSSYLKEWAGRCVILLAEDNIASKIYWMKKQWRLIKFVLRVIKSNRRWLKFHRWQDITL